MTLATVKGSTLTLDSSAFTASISATSKVYDGNTVAAVVYGDDRVAGDVFSVTGTATFNNKNVGAGKPVSATGIGITGTDAGNYALAGSTASTSADITARTLNVTATATNKVYD